MNQLQIAATLFGVFLTCGGSLSAQQASEAGAQKPLTPEASLNIHFLSDLQLSPDGSRLAFVVSEAPKAEKRAQHVWMYEKSKNAARQFTFSNKSENTPRWSPDGTRLAFLSDRGGDEQQIYVMIAGGGEAVARTKGKSSVKTFEWSIDGKSIAFIAPDAKTDEEEQKEKDKNDARAADKDEKHPRLWVIGIDSGEAKAVTSPKWEVKELAWMPSGENLVIVATDHPESDRDTDRIFGVHTADGTMQLLSAPHGPFGEIRVSPDGKTIGFIGSREDGPSPHDLMLLPVGSEAAHNLTGLNLDRQIFEFKWQRDGTLTLIAANGFHTDFKSFSPGGAAREMASAGSANPSAFAVSDSSELFFASQTATRPRSSFFGTTRAARGKLRISTMHGSNMRWRLRNFTNTNPSMALRLKLHC